MTFTKNNAAQGADTTVDGENSTLQAEVHLPSFSVGIQALRALAVALVVIYHVWPGLVPGGFVGVDIFFVISGYLITLGMLKEYQRTATLSLTQFYARRIRRILPAATTTIVATVLVAWVVMPNTWWASISQHAKASLLYFENWLLAKEATDYLAEGQNATPFQHFWSLSVEEQFYIVWPLLFIAVIWVAFRVSARSNATVQQRITSKADRMQDDQERAVRVGMRMLLVVLAVLTVVSFVWSARLVARADESAYFVTQARMWELCVGALLAYVVVARSRTSRDSTVFSFVTRHAFIRDGVVAIAATALVASAFFYNAGTPFPGPAALVPTLSTAALIFVTTVHCPQATRFARVRSMLVEHKTVQWLGDISYSLYLWHWPLLIMAPFMFERIPQAAQLWLVVMCALILAHLTRKFIELPAQHGALKKWRPRMLYPATAALTAVMVSAAAVPNWHGERQIQQELDTRAQLQQDPPERLGAQSLAADRYEPFAIREEVLVPAPQEVRADLPDGVIEGECKSEVADDFTPHCLFGDEDAELTVALIGDSHIEQYLPAFQELAKDNEFRIETYFHASCPFSLAVRQSDFEKGSPCYKSNKDTLKKVLADDNIDIVVTSNRTDVSWNMSDKKPDPETGFRKIWKQLVDDGKDVYVFGDNPRALKGDSTRDCVAQSPEEPQVCDRDRDESFVMDYQAEAADGVHGVEYVDTRGWFCTDDTCPAVIGNVMVYRDDQHVTATYARTLAPRVLSEIKQFSRFQLSL
ncbi:acyltransferase family protein [Timonella sp. A28]|uniref:acyltransferase family protein n=1 Tax=Timonella sp. A28 TaxID=3442640 RepID=UPI003EBC68B4